MAVDKINKRSLLPILFIIAVFVTGCQAASSRNGTVGITSPSDCFQVNFLGVTETSEVASTWSYRVEGGSCDEKLSSWILELPACATVLAASPPTWESVSPDPGYQMNRVKWETGADFQEGEFHVVLSSDLSQGMTRTGVIQGEEISIVSIAGPACEASAGAPMARIQVQSANCREKPVGKAKKLVLFYRNQEAEIVGRNDDPNNPWWYVKIPNTNENCWLWGRTATTTGAVDQLPIMR